MKNMSDRAYQGGPYLQISVLDYLKKFDVNKEMLQGNQGDDRWLTSWNYHQTEDDDSELAKKNVAATGRSSL